MKQVSHLVGARPEEAIDEIEVYAVINDQWLAVVQPNDCLDRKKLNVCVDREGKIREFVYTGN
jgi:hypothetical protein